MDNPPRFLENLSFISEAKELNKQEQAGLFNNSHSIKIQNVSNVSFARFSFSSKSLPGNSKKCLRVWLMFNVFLFMVVPNKR